MFRIPPPPTATTIGPGPVSVDKFLIKNSVISAEIMWTLRLIVTHQSFKSSENTEKLFTKMFPDSTIAKQFRCGERKAAYLAVFGIGEYLKTCLDQKVTGPYVIIFDESLNKKMQEKQMDVIVRFWDEEMKKIETRYYSSQFMGHARSEDMVEHFVKALGKLKLANLLQIGMEGPNVNWKFFDLIKQKLISDHGSHLLNIGSCGLHIVHNSFKAGFVSTGWKIGDFLASLYYLFKDSPARREDFQNVSGSTLMPLKFVQHRWLENVPVVERVLQIHGNVVKYVKAVEEKKLSNPRNKSFECIQEHINDQLLLPKLHFFKYVAVHLQPFLTLYQTNKPLICFLGDDLSALLRSLMKLFIKKDSVEKSDVKLSKMDVADKNIHLNYNEIDIGFSANIALREGKGSERQKMEIKINAKSCLIEVVKKNLSKAPVAYSVVRYLSCLNPKKTASEPDVCKENFQKLLLVLLRNEKVIEIDCDNIIQEYKTFLDDIPLMGKEKFLSFDKNSENVDVFFYEHTCMVGKYTKLFEIVKMLLLLSHGQAAVERGFSVNKEVEVENMKQQTLVAQRLICDFVTSVGGILNVDISETMIKSVKSAHQKYDAFLESERQRKKSQELLGKRKNKLDEIAQIKSKRQKLGNEVDELTKTAEKLYEKAETTSKIEFVSQANAMKRVAKEKEVEIIELDKQIKTCVESLKQL